jgi:hypothetical protein
VEAVAGSYSAVVGFAEEGSQRMDWVAARRAGVSAVVEECGLSAHLAAEEGRRNWKVAEGIAVHSSVVLSLEITVVGADTLRGYSVGECQ